MRVAEAELAPGVTVRRSWQKSLLTFLIIAIVGATIAPWQHFFQQSCVAEKRLDLAGLLHASR